MKPFEKYDVSNPISIEGYGKKLIGKTFKDVEDESLQCRVGQNNKSYFNPRRKGGLGNLIEELHFGIKINSDQNADFIKAGVELKVTPYTINQNGKLVAKERLVLTMISYEKPVQEDFYKSHVWAKCKSILLIYYCHDKEIQKIYFEIKYAKLFSPSEEDQIIIRNDYKKITSKIKNGKAHELHEGDTMYLGACTKGATAEKSTVKQYYQPHTLARKRAYCFKQSYMTIILNNYVIEKDDKYENIVDSSEKLRDKSIEAYICEKIDRHRGKSDKNLCNLFGREYNNNKAQWSDLAYRMLGLKSNKAEELAKANIKVKAIRIEHNSRIIESSSLPTINFNEIVQEEWDDSTLYSYFDETKFLFVIFKRKDDAYFLMGAQIWNMPHQDFHKVKKGWLKVQQVIKEGVVLTPCRDKNNLIFIKNNLPKKNSNEVIHIRPHAQKSYYVLKDGTCIGPGKISDSDELPDGRRMTKQSFWLNNTYIFSQIKNKLT